jgi:hypothetical protein
VKNNFSITLPFWASLPALSSEDAQWLPQINPKRRRWVMNSLNKSNGMKYIVLMTLALALTGSVASAQTIEAQGKFNLPFTARWGGLVLAPGAYSFTVSRRGVGTPCITVSQGSRPLGMIMTGPWDTVGAQSSTRSYLTAVAAHGAYRITSLDLRDQGIEFEFVVPKTEALEASNATKRARNVPVLLASK